MFHIDTNRPKPELTKTFAEKLFDLFAILSAVLVIVFLIIKWTSMPEMVPIHFDFNGKPDGWGTRWMLTIVLIVGIIMWIGLHFLEKVPQIHNYMWLTKENAQRQYRNSQFFLNVIKNCILIFFSYITYDSVGLALGEKSLVGTWEMVLFLVTSVMVAVLFIVRSYRLK